MIRFARPELAHFIASRPRDAERIAAVVAERRTSDPRAIQCVLDAPASALGDGAL